MAVMNGTGRIGKSFQDRELAARVRTRAMEEIELILNEDPKTEKWSDLKKNLLLKMSSSLLPRLNEHSGPEGSPIPILELDGLQAYNSYTENNEVK